jgi:lysozyme
MSDRKPIADAFRAFMGGTLTQGETNELDAFLDRFRPRVAAPPKPLPKKTLIAVIGASAATILTPLVMQWEGRETTAYKDIVGVWTICDGDTKDVHAGQVATEAECNARLEQQLIAHAEPVLKCTPSLAGRPHQLAAAASLAYNVGTAAYCRSTLDRRFDAGDWRGGCDALLLFNKAGGREVRGLTNRRRAERDICLKGL